jgi:hypothetical protein
MKCVDQFIPDHSDGKFKSACNRQYFISSSRSSIGTQLESEIECCKYGLKLWSVETPEELACFAAMNAGSSLVLVFSATIL